MHSSGTAVLLQTIHPEIKSSLNITTGATVYFINLTCSRYGGAVYGWRAIMYTGAKAKVVFKYNVARHGGAVKMSNGMITVGTESYVTLIYNHAIILLNLY